MTISQLVGICILVIGTFAQAAPLSTANDPFIRSNGSTRTDILVAENLLVVNPANADQSMAFVVCRDMRVESRMQKQCKVQSYAPEFLDCGFKGTKSKLATTGKSINLKPEYNSTIATKAMSADSPQVGYIYCSKDSEGEAGCQLQKSAPAFIGCRHKSEERAETDRKRPVAVPKVKPVAPADTYKLAPAHQDGTM